MSPICMHCILNTNAINIINLTLDITHIPHRHSLWQVVLVVEDIVTFRRSELSARCDGQLIRLFSLFFFLLSLHAYIGVCFAMIVWARHDRQKAFRVARDHRTERWTRSHESPTLATVRHSIPSHQNLSPSYSYLENEVKSNCALTLENMTSNRYV